MAPDEVLALIPTGTARRARRRGGPVKAILFIAIFGAIAPVALQAIGIGPGLAIYDGLVQFGRDCMNLLQEIAAHMEDLI